MLGAATVSEAYEIQHLVSAGGTEGGLRDSSHQQRHDRPLQRPLVQKELRYLGKSYGRPVVTEANMNRLPAKRRSQSLTPKIVVAGMTKRLECTLDRDGAILAAKSTSIAFSERIDLRYLLGILNSKLVSFFYSSVFGGNKLQGGYLRIGPPQLRSIPVPVTDVSETAKKSKPRPFDNSGRADASASEVCWCCGFGNSP